MSREIFRLPAAALGLLALGLAACSSSSTDTAGVSGTIAPAARVEETQVDAKDVKVEEASPPAKDATPSKDVDGALSGAGAAGSHSSKPKGHSGERTSEAIGIII